MFSKIIQDNCKDINRCCIAIMGAGGKTGLLYRLGQELKEEIQKVLLTSLTISEDSGPFPTLLTSEMTGLSLASYFKQSNPIFLMHSRKSSNKLVGVSPAELAAARKQSEICLFECDGARGLSLKAHNASDPSVPSFATHAIVVVGADVVNTAISDGLVHRPALFASLWDRTDSDILDVELIAEIVSNEKGYGKMIPGNTQKLYYVNKADTHPREAEHLARTIRKVTGFPTYFGSIHANICYKVES